REEQRLEGGVRALVDPGEERADREGEHRRAGRERDRIAEQAKGIGAGKRGAVVLERETRGAGGGFRREEALPQEKRGRHERKPGDQRDRAADREAPGVDREEHAAGPRRSDVDRVTALRHAMGAGRKYASFHHVAGPDESRRGGRYASSKGRGSGG